MRNSKIRSRSKPSRRAWAGFTLLEILVAATVMAFGVIGISLIQTNLGASSDAARLRAEALRVGQLKLDEFRGFDRIGVDPGDVGLFTYLNIKGGEDEVGPVSIDPELQRVDMVSNTTFSRKWVVTEDTAFKLVTVTVSWVARDRSPEVPIDKKEKVVLSTVIARSDPAGIGVMGVGPGSTGMFRPKNRSVDIPFEAIDLKNGSSAYRLSPVMPLLIYENLTGRVKSACTNVTKYDLVNNVVVYDSCTDYATPAYTLSGYVRFCPSGCSVSDAKDPVSMDKRGLATPNPLSFDSKNRAAETPVSTDCYSARQVILKDGKKVRLEDELRSEVEEKLRLSGKIALPYDNAEKLLVEDELNKLITTSLINYLCVVQPQPPVAGNTAPLWSGRVTLNPYTTLPTDPPYLKSWSVSMTTYKVCRYTADYQRTSNTYCLAKGGADGDSLCRMSNDEHPLWYRAVNASLANQNYLVVNAADACPVMGAATPLDNPPTYVNASTAVHQTNSDPAVVSGELSFTCIAQNCSDRVNIEPTSTSTPLVTE